MEYVSVLADRASLFTAITQTKRKLNIYNLLKNILQGRIVIEYCIKTQNIFGFNTV
jgi:hypothetical protein